MTSRDVADDRAGRAPSATPPAAAARRGWPGRTSGSSGSARAPRAPPAVQYSHTSSRGSAPHCFLKWNVPSPGVERPKSNVPKPALDGELQHLPVEQDVGAERIELAQRRGPRHLDGVAATSGRATPRPGGPGPNHEDARVAAEGRQHRAEELQRVDRRAEVAHVVREHLVEGVEQLEAAGSAVKLGSSPPCAPGCAPCGRAPAHCASAVGSSRSSIATLWRLRRQFGEQLACVPQLEVRAARPTSPRRWPVRAARARPLALSARTPP